MPPSTGTPPPYGPEALEQADRRNLRWLLWLLLALALIGAGVAAYVLLQPDKVTVPDVVGRHSASAAQMLNQAGFEVHIQPVQSDKVAKDRVISQNPPPHDEAEEGSTVTLTVSGGPGDAAVPDVVGLTETSAQNRLEKAGFKSHSRVERSDSVEQGRVIESRRRRARWSSAGRRSRSSCPAGPRRSWCPTWSARTATPRPSRSTTPVCGRRSPSARQPTRTRARCSSRRPRRASKAPKDSEVKLVVAKAPPDVEVPDVSGDDLQGARDALHAAGFKVVRQRPAVTDPAQDGLVIEQAPGAGESAPKGSRVSIVIGKLSTKPTPTPSPAPDSVRVAVLYGGRSSEHEVSLASAESVREGVAAAGHEVLPVLIERGGAWIHDGEVLSLRPGKGLVAAEVVFPVLHGPFGEDGTVQGVLELLDVPYVGAGVLASSLCMDKVVFKEVMHAVGVPQVRSAGVREARWRADPDGVHAQLALLGTPIFVKPARLGSSVGIAKVWAESEVEAALEGAFEHDSLVIVEAFSDGLEVECSVIGLRRAGGLGAGRDRPGGSRLVRLRGEVQPGRDGAGGTGPDSRLRGR